MFMIKLYLEIHERFKTKRQTKIIKVLVHTRRRRIPFWDLKVGSRRLLINVLN